MSQSSGVDDINWEKTLVERLSEYAIFRLTKTGEVATWNAGASRIKGYCAAEIIGQSFSVFYPPEDREAGIPGAALKAAAEPVGSRMKAGACAGTARDSGRTYSSSRCLTLTGC